MKVIIFNNKIFFNAQKIKSKQQLLNTLLIVPDSVIGIVVSRIYDWYFKGAINLRCEYKKYYKQEFENFKEFLCKHYLIHKRDINIIVSENYWMKNLEINIDYNLRTFLEDEDEFNQIFWEKIERKK